MELQSQTERKFKHIVYVTFGQKFRYEKHLHIPEAHPEGWVEFHFNHSLEFTQLKDRFLGLYYAHIYTYKEFDPFSEQSAVWFPKGCLRVITMADLLKPISLTDYLE